MADYTIIKTPAVQPVLRGTPRLVVLNKWTVSSSAFGKTTVENYDIAAGQMDTARKFMDDCLAIETCMRVERVVPKGDTLTVEVEWDLS